MLAHENMSEQVPICFLSVVLAISLGYIDLPQVFTMHSGWHPAGYCQGTVVSTVEEGGRLRAGVEDKG